MGLPDEQERKVPREDPPICLFCPSDMAFKWAIHFCSQEGHRKKRKSRGKKERGRCCVSLAHVLSLSLHKPSLKKQNNKFSGMSLLLLLNNTKKQTIR